MTEKKENDLIVVLGPRRSGTNYLETLLEKNLSCRVANINSVDSLKRQSRPHLYHSLGGKHDIGIDTIKRINLEGGLVIAQSRNPIDWIISRSKYYLRMSPENQEHDIPAKIPKWVREEYNKFFEIVRSTKSEARSILLKYEDTATNPSSAIQKISEELLIQKRQAEVIKIDKEMAPGGNPSGQFKVKNPYRQYSRDGNAKIIEAAAPEFDKATLSWLGYELV